MHRSINIIARVVLACVTFAGFSMCQTAEAARGRACQNPACTTFVSDSGTLLRGPRFATEFGAVPSVSDLQAIKTLGCNALHLYAECFGQGYTPGTQSNAVDQVVAMTRTNGLYLVMTIGNWVNNGQFDYAFTMGFWNFYAARYRNETHVLFEIQNEPVPWSTGYPANAINMERDAYFAIRASAPDTPVLFFSYAGFDNGAGALQDIAALGSGIDWSNAGVAFHGYAGEALVKSCLQTVLSNGYACVQTEFCNFPWGTGTDSIYQDTAETGDFERLGVSWLNFLDLPQLQDDTRFKNPINNDGIVWVPDYGNWPSGTRNTYGNSNEPWTTTGLRGTLHIEAENFDTGGEGVAYHDADPANQGGVYRTDEGVDIQPASDVGGGYGIGSINAGEWLEYTLLIAQPGIYNLSLRVASTAAGSLDIHVGGVDKTGTWDLPVTGGSQTWTTVNKTVSLVPGRQMMRIAMLSSGFNLNWIELSPATSGPLATGTYAVLARHSGKALEVANSSTENGANVDQGSYVGEDNQKWMLTHLGAGQYKFVGLQSGKSLNVYGAQRTDGANVHIWTYGGGRPEETWIITPTDGGFYRVTPVNSGLSLEVQDASTADSANVRQWTYTGGSNQQWTFQRFAAQVDWQNGTGDFSDPSHWIGGSVPGLMDSCQFPDNGSYTVSFTGSEANDKARFTSTDGGAVAFNLSGYVWNLTNGLAFDAGGLNSNVSLDNGNLLLGGDGVVLSCFNDAQPSCLTLGTNSSSQISKVRLDNAHLTLGGGTHVISDEVLLTSPFSTGSKMSSMTVSNATVVLRSNFWCGQGNGSTGIVNLVGGTMIVSNYFCVGAATATSVGIVNITGGALYTDAGNGLGDADRATGVLNLNSGTCTCRSRFEVGHRAGAKGVLNISGGKFTANSDMFVGNFENGQCNTTGKVTVAGGTLEVKNTLAMGLSTNCYGSVRVMGCSTSTLQRVSVGSGPFGYGEWYQANGWVTLAGDLEIGSQAESAGLVIIDGGVFSNKTGSVQAGMRGNGRMVVNDGDTFVNSTLFVGRHAGGRGAFEMNGGAVSCYNLTVGDESGASGSYVQSGGVMSNRTDACVIGNAAGSTGSLSVINGVLHSEQTLFVGNSGVGTMTVSNGYVRLANGLYVGNNASATGTLTLAGGVFTSLSPAFCGNSGVGTMIISGGTNFFAGSMVIGNSKEGHLTISGGETYVTGQNQYLRTTMNTGSAGRIDVSGGYLKVDTGNYLDIGSKGACVLEMTGGQIDTWYLRMVANGTSASSPVSKIIMNGGRLNVLFTQYLVDAAGATGEVYLVNGVLSVNQLRGWWGTLNVFFDGGTLEARQSSSDFIMDNQNTPLGHVLTARGLVLDSNGYTVQTGLALPDAPGEHGTLTKKGAGIFILRGNTSFTGPIAVQQGEVEVGGSGMVTLQGGVRIDGSGLLDLHNRAQDFTLGAGSVSRVDGTVQLASGKALIVPGTASLSGTGSLDRMTLLSGSILAKDKATGASLLHIANLTMAPGATVALTGYTDAEFRAGIPFVNGTHLSLPRSSQMTFTLNGVVYEHVGLKVTSDGTEGYRVSAYTFNSGILLRVL